MDLSALCGIAHIVPRLTWRRAWCDPPLALGGPSQACTCPCLSPWRVMCWDMRSHRISSRRAVPRDSWTICWLGCGRCKMQTKPMAWSRLPWFPTGLSLTPWPFAEYTWDLEGSGEADIVADHMLAMGTRARALAKV